MPEFPDIAKTDFSVDGDKNREARNILDFAYTYWQSDSVRRTDLKKQYNYYNGYIDEDQVKYLTHISGEKSKVPYKRFMLGRSKMNLLLGEFLRIGINPTARAINQEAMNEKAERYKTLLGLAFAKPYIEKARQMGYDVYQGINIPEKDDPTAFNMDNFKVQNEIAMQYIINEKIETENILSKMYDMAKDITIGSEAHGWTYRTPEGIDTIGRINPLNALFIEQDNDPFLLRSPYRGQVQYMHYHEILNEFDLTNDERERLAQLRQFGGSNCISVNGKNSEFLIPVVRLQWKAYAPVRTKTEYPKGIDIPYKTILSNDYYNKNSQKIERDIVKGKYNLQTKYKQTIWEGVRIYDTIYKNIREKEYVIQQRDQNGKYRAKFDYFSILFGTVNGKRISVQSLMSPLEDAYDEVRYLIRKETNKMKGKNIVWDRAFMGGKTFKDIYKDLVEEGVIEINSADEGNWSMENILGKIKPIDQVDLGPSSALPALMQIGMDIERVMDRITGLNDDRQGVTKATVTATTNINNLEASQSMTYDIFYFLTLFTNNALSLLAEKTKINWAFIGEDGRMIPYGDDVIKYIRVTRNLTNDDYAMVISDGRKENEIRTKAERLFEAQVNANMMSSSDAIEFWMKSSLGEALNVLRKAEERKQQYQRENAMIQKEMAQAKEENAYQMALENREDTQKHEVEIEAIKIEGKKEIEAMKQTGKMITETEKNNSKNNLSLNKNKNSLIKS